MTSCKTITSLVKIKNHFLFLSHTLNLQYILLTLIICMVGLLLLFKVEARVQSVSNKNKIKRSLMRCSTSPKPDNHAFCVWTQCFSPVFSHHWLISCIFFAIIWYQQVLSSFINFCLSIAIPPSANQTFKNTVPFYYLRGRFTP